MTTTDLRGLPLLDAAIAHIEASPETWVQEAYRCASGMCLAGWIGVLAGGHWVASADHMARREYMAAEPGDPPRFVDTESDYGPMIHVAERAEHLLGFSRFLNGEPWGLTDLFHGGNDLGDIKRMRDEIAARLGAS